MSRATWNAIVDAICFAAFLGVLSTGVAMRWLLPPGSGHHTTLWSLDRHAWGSIHFGVAVALLIGLSAHLFLHGRFVWNLVRGRARSGSASRAILGIVALLAIVALALAPLLGPVERNAEGRGPPPGHVRPR